MLESLLQEKTKLKKIDKNIVVINKHAFWWKQQWIIQRSLRYRISIGSLKMLFHRRSGVVDCIVGTEARTATTAATGDGPTDGSGIWRLWFFGSLGGDGARQD